MLVSQGEGYDVPLSVHTVYTSTLIFGLAACVSMFNCNHAATFWHKHIIVIIASSTFDMWRVLFLFFQDFKIGDLATLILRPLTSQAWCFVIHKHGFSVSFFNQVTLLHLPFVILCYEKHVCLRATEMKRPWKELKASGTETRFIFLPRSNFPLSDGSKGVEDMWMLNT